MVEREEVHMRHRRTSEPVQGSMLTLMNVKSSDVQPKLHITHEERDEKDNVLTLHTVGVPDDDDEEECVKWDYWLGENWRGRLHAKG